jgi:hypothetical protein
MDGELINGISINSDVRTKEIKGREFSPLPFLTALSIQHDYGQ